MSCEIAAMFFVLVVVKALDSINIDCRSKGNGVIKNNSEENESHPLFVVVISKTQIIDRSPRFEFDRPYLHMIVNEKKLFQD